MRLGRLAVDLSLTRKGSGRGLFKDAIQRGSHAADTNGIRGIVVHPISDYARAFYIKLGLSESPRDPPFMVVPLKGDREVSNGEVLS